MSQQIVKVFIRKTGCPKCHQVLEGLKVLKEKGVEFQIYDVDTVDGLAEASYHGILSTPTIIRVDDEGEEISRHVDLEDFIKKGNDGITSTP